MNDIRPTRYNIGMKFFYSYKWPSNDHNEQVASDKGCVVMVYW